MVWWVAAIQAVGAIAGGRQQQEAAERAGYAAAQLIRAETAEEIRRTQREFDYVFGQQRAILGASGVALTAGTPATQQQALRTEQSLQLAWIQRAGDLRRRAAERSGQYVGKQAFAQGVASGIGAFGQAYSQYNQQFQAQQRDPVGNTGGAR